MQPAEQRERQAGSALGEQHPGQHQEPRPAGVLWLAVRGEAGRFGPVHGGGDIALGQQQPHSLRRDRVEQAGRSRAAWMASPIASRAPAGSSLACRIQASVARHAAIGAV